MKTFEPPFENSLQELEEVLHQAGKHFPYPPQPDIVRAVMRRTTRQRPRLVWRPLVVGLAVVALLCAGLLLVPPARAAFIRFIQIGVIQIFLEPAPTVQATVQGNQPATASPVPQASFLGLEGRTTLAAARKQVGFDIHLPAYPPDLGDPDQVFVQDQGGPVVLLVWLDPEQVERIRLSLMILGPGMPLGKSAPMMLEDTLVHGEPAIWMEGNHVLFMNTLQGEGQIQLSVSGNVLVWERDDLTYRLEGELSMEEARRIAESLP